MESFKKGLARRHIVFWLRNTEEVYESLKDRLAVLRDSIFLSYSSKDREFAIWLRGEFKKDNYSFWRDGDSIEAGSEWMDQLRKALEACHIMVLLLSPDSINSKYVTLEVEEFQTRRRRIFPVKVRPCDVPEYLSKLQVVDATENRDKAYRRLKRGVEDALKAE
jgi:TIR domain-containing protein